MEVGSGKMEVFNSDLIFKLNQTNSNDFKFSNLKPCILHLAPFTTRNFKP